MKFTLIIISMFLNTFCICQKYSSAITQKGHYYGDNLLIQNTEINNNQLSVYSVYVNEVPIKNSIDSKIIEVDFSDLNIKEKDPITIIIYHHPNKSPKIMNPEVLVKKLDSTIINGTTQTNVIDKEIKSSIDNKVKVYNESRYQYYLHYCNTSTKNKFKLNKSKKTSIQFNRGEFKIKYRY